MIVATAISFQILSNFANDYGDGLKGTDNKNRIGPKRTLQMGLISPKQMIDNMEQRKDLASERLDQIANAILKQKVDVLHRAKERLSINLLNNIYDRKERQLQSAKSLINSYNYKNVLCYFIIVIIHIKMNMIITTFLLLSFIIIIIIT